MVEAFVGSVASGIGGSLVNKAFGGDKAQAGGSGMQQIHNTTEVLIPDYLKKIIHGDDDSLVSRANEFSLRPYEAYTDPRYAGFNQDQQNAMQGIRDLQGMYAPQFDAALGMNQQVADRANQGFVTPESIAKYMNPYQQNVTDIAKRESLRDFDKQMNTLGDRAMMTGAFGGDRNAIAEMESYRNINQRLDDLQTQGSHAAYNNALNTSMQTGLAETQALGNAATNQANLASAAQGSRFNDLAGLQQIGGQQQAFDQMGMDFGYGQFKEEQQYPAMQMSQLASTIYPLLGQSGSQTGNTQNFSPGLSNANAALGGAALGSSIFGDFSGVGNSIKGFINGAGRGGQMGPFNTPNIFGQYAQGGKVDKPKEEHKYFGGGLASMLGGSASGGGGLSSLIGGLGSGGFGGMGLLSLLNKTGLGDGLGLDGLFGGDDEKDKMPSAAEKLLMFSPAAKMWDDPKSMSPLASLLFSEGGKIPKVQKYAGGGITDFYTNNKDDNMKLLNWIKENPAEAAGLALTVNPAVRGASMAGKGLMNFLPKGSTLLNTVKNPIAQGVAGVGLMTAANMSGEEEDTKNFSEVDFENEAVKKLMGTLDVTAKEEGLSGVPSEETPKSAQTSSSGVMSSQPSSSRDPSMEKWARNPDRSIFAKAPLPGLAMAAKIFDSAGVNPLSAFGQGLGAYINETKEGNAAEAKAKTDEMDNLIDMMNARSVQTQAALQARKAQLEEASFPMQQRKQQLEMQQLEREAASNPQFQRALEMVQEKYQSMGAVVTIEEMMREAKVVEQSIRSAESQGSSEATAIRPNARYNPETGKMDPVL